MIDHITFGVFDFDRSIAFYDKALAPLGIRRLFDVPTSEADGVQITGYGDDRPFFWIAGEKPTSGLLHVAFGTLSRSVVDAFHEAAIGAGGTDNGPPGLRVHYHPDYYAAYIFDPDGNNIEVVCHSSGS